MSPAEADAVERVRRILREQIGRARELARLHDGLRDRQHIAELDRATARTLDRLLWLVDSGVLTDQIGDEDQQLLGGIAAITGAEADAAGVRQAAYAAHTTNVTTRGGAL